MLQCADCTDAVKVKALTLGSDIVDESASAEFATYHGSPWEPSDAIENMAVDGPLGPFLAPIRSAMAAAGWCTALTPLAASAAGRSRSLEAAVLSAAIAVGPGCYGEPHPGWGASGSRITDTLLVISERLAREANEDPTDEYAAELKVLAARAVAMAAPQRSEL